MLLGINVYYFFIARFCFPRCFSNLLSTFSSSKPKMSFKDRKLVIELVVVMLVGSAVFVPGGHMQFQIWYMQLIPFCLLLTRAHPILTFSLYSYVIPCRIGH